MADVAQIDLLSNEFTANAGELDRQAIHTCRGDAPRVGIDKHYWDFFTLKRMGDLPDQGRGPRKNHPLRVFVRQAEPAGEWAEREAVDGDRADDDKERGHHESIGLGFESSVVGEFQREERSDGSGDDAARMNPGEQEPLIAGEFAANGGNERRQRTNYQNERRHERQTPPPDLLDFAPADTDSRGQHDK